MRSLLALTLALSTPTLGQSLDATCTFNVWTVYQLSTGQTETQTMTQYLAIRDDKTTPETGIPSGGNRATNCKTWTRIDWSWAQWICDAGELLTIGGGDVVNGFGTYNAFLQSATGELWATTRIGTCTGDFRKSGRDE